MQRTFKSRLTPAAAAASISPLSLILRIPPKTEAGVWPLFSSISFVKGDKTAMLLLRSSVQNHLSTHSNVIFTINLKVWAKLCSTILCPTARKMRSSERFWNYKCGISNFFPKNPNNSTELVRSRHLAEEGDLIDQEGQGADHMFLKSWKPGTDNSREGRPVCNHRFLNLAL